MTRIKTLALALAALGMLSVGCAADAQHRQHTGKAYEIISSRVDDVLDDVEADEVQRDKVHEIKDRLYESAQAVRDGSKESRQLAFDELRKDDPDAAKLHAMVDERVDEWRKVLHEGVDGVLEVHATLTPEQRQEIADMIEEHTARHHSE